MCGIVGYMIKVASNQQKSFFIDSLYTDALRGMDATGVLSVHERTHELNVIKKAMPAYDFLDFVPAQKVLSQLHFASIAVGHNRAATKGDKSSSQGAHPFTHGDITLVHNGTLRSWYSLPDYKNFTVDSEMICYSIYKDGVAETIKKLNGAFALVWYNKAEKSLNMIRNTERPLYIGFTKDNHEMYFASEEDMLKWTTSRNNIELVSTELLDPGSLYTFTLPKANTERAIRKEVKPLELYTFQSTQTTQSTTTGNRASTTTAGGHLGRHVAAGLNAYGLKIGDKITCSFYERNPTGGGYFKYVGIMDEDPWMPVFTYSQDAFILNKQYRTKISGGKFDSSKPNGDEIAVDSKKMRAVNKVVSLNQNRNSEPEHDDIHWIPGPGGKQISSLKWKELTKDGCSNCGERLSHWDADDIAWTTDGSPICPDCIEEVNKMITTLAH